MSKVYKLPFWSRVAVWIADWLPNRIRASVYIDTLDSFDEDNNYKPVMTQDKDSTSHFQAISGIRVETLRRQAYTDGLKAKLVDRPQTSNSIDGGSNDQ